MRHSASASKTASSSRPKPTVIWFQTEPVCCFAAGVRPVERARDDAVPFFLRAVLPEDVRFRVPVPLPVFLRVDVLFFFVEVFFVAAKKDYTYFS